MRDLKISEIECKISQIKANGLSLLLYKTARTDMEILNEEYGVMNWQCKYEEIKGNMYCGISVYDKEKNQWITKFDCGVESAFGDKEKGEASDAFKRAGFKWGIGVELYTSPFIWIPSAKCNIKDGKCYDKFEVTNIEINDKEIIALTIVNKTTGVECFNWSKKGQIKQEVIKDELISDVQARGIYKALMGKLETNEKVVEYLMNKYNIENTSKLMKSQYAEIVREFK